MPLIELEWSGLYDAVPDSSSEAAAWVAFDGEVRQNEDLEPLRSALESAATTKLILGQRPRDMRSPTLPEMRERIKGFYEAHGETVATMPAFDGIGRLGDETMFDELLGLLRTSDTKLVEPEDQRRSRLSAAAAGTGAFIYVAERAGDPELRAAAGALADGFHDFALRRIQRQRRGEVDAGLRRGFGEMVRDVLVGFAW